ncbi:cation:proton antiporter [Microaerobacter geothermalis]|uniref:monovalent cation:proton antiporter family protein n=1 Tax=Microaerobacter geothermalis TaxID=674972 RepID=UPI001F190ED2|nr:cation:proton antiporter [Microaerobacter geothermalis]MCF6093364.1 cation:proton antiporter [Microaerobacter geothermalis]
MNEAVEFNYISLLIITTLAFFVPLILAKIPKISIPIVVGEIIAGMIVGKSGFNLISEDVYLTFLSDFGFAYLMFLSGLEIDFHLLSTPTAKSKKRHVLNHPVVLAMGTFILTLAISFTFAYVLYQYGLVRSYWLMTLILSTTSLGVVVPILKEKKMAGTPLGQTILLSALFADFITMVLITVVVSIEKGGRVAEILLILILFVVFFLLYRISKFLSKLHIIDKLAHATSQIKVRGSFFLILVLVSLSQQLGKEVIILGAFLAGVIVSLISKRHETELHLKLDAIGYGFFIPIFFIHIGVNFDLSMLINSYRALWLIPLLLLAAYLVKIIPTMIYRFSYSWRETISSGFLVSSRLSLIIAASSIALELGLIDVSVNSAIILVAIITVTLSPMIFQRLAPAEKQENEKSIVIIGVSETALYLSKRLKTIYKNITHLAVDETKTGLIKENRIKVIPRNVDHVNEALYHLNIEKADIVVVATEVEEYNYRVASELEKNINYGNIFVVTSNEKDAISLEARGIHVIRPSRAAELVLENLIRNPKAFSLITEERKNWIIEEGILTNDQWAGKAIKSLHLPATILILSLFREGEPIVPHGNTILEKGDYVTFVGSPDDVELFLASLKID